jgi:hypothetical protein
MNSPNEKSSQKNELSLGGQSFQITDPISLLSVLPEEERKKIVVDYAAKSLDVDNELKRKISDAKLASMQMDNFVDRANADTQGKFHFEQEFATGTGKAKISTRTVQSTSIVTVLVIIGLIIVLIAIVTH